MKNTTLFFMLLFFANQLFAQYQNDYVREDYKLLRTVTLVNDAMKTTYIEGSPYQRKTNLTSVFPGKEDDINTFIKKNKIRKNSPDGLLSLLGYISQLSN